MEALLSNSLITVLTSVLAVVETDCVVVQQPVEVRDITAHVAQCWQPGQIVVAVGRF